MEEIKSKLRERQNYLLQLKKEKMIATKNMPEGKLRISSHGCRTQYYLRQDTKDINGLYLKDKKLAKLLAQKEYDKKIINLADKEIYVINKFLDNYPAKNAEEFYQTLHSERQKLIAPIKETAEQFIEKWESVEYQGKSFPEEMPEYYSFKGERVRSKSELIIADFLQREGIPYRYECPLTLKGFGTIYPDFTVLNVKKRKEIYWEHFGMMDDTEYSEKAIQKIINYEQHSYFQGENLILTYETKRNPLNQKILKMMVEHYLK